MEGPGCEFTASALWLALIHVVARCLSEFDLATDGRRVESRMELLLLK